MCGFTVLQDEPQDEPQSMKNQMNTNWTSVDA